MLIFSNRSCGKEKSFGGRECFIILTKNDEEKNWKQNKNVNKMNSNFMPTSK